MKLIADLHTHTIASTHALSTLQEMIHQAQALGLSALAVTDHAPAMPDAPHSWYFTTMKRLPNILPNGFVLLRGAEVNALDKEAALDLEADLLEKLDWVIVSLHQSCIAPLSKADATELWLRVAENPVVDMLGHPEQRQYAFDCDCVTKALAVQNKVVEVNANSANVRRGNEEQLRQLVLACKKNNTKVSVNSDAHSIFELGNTGQVTALLQELDFPPELVVNSSRDRLLAHLRERGKAVAAKIPWSTAL